jgi:hypothetical protein
MIAATTTADEKIAKELGKPTYTIEELNAVESEDVPVMEK